MRLQAFEATEIRARVGSPFRSRLVAALIPWSVLAAEISISVGNEILESIFAFLAIACGVYLVSTYYSRLSKRLALPASFAFRHPRQHQSLLAWWYLIPERGAPYGERLVALSLIAGGVGLIVFLTATLIF